MTTVCISTDPLSIEDLLAVADGARVELDGAVLAAMGAARSVVEDALTARTAVYGLTTQVGHGKDTRLTEQTATLPRVAIATITSQPAGAGWRLHVEDPAAARLEKRQKSNLNSSSPAAPRNTKTRSWTPAYPLCRRAVLNTMSSMSKLMAGNVNPMAAPIGVFW